MATYFALLSPKRLAQAKRVYLIRNDSPQMHSAQRAGRPIPARQLRHGKRGPWTRIHVHQAPQVSLLAPPQRIRCGPGPGFDGVGAWLIMRYEERQGRVAGQRANLAAPQMR
jgi:hypothetical protein